MLYLSELIDQPVRTRAGVKLGRLHEVVVHLPAPADIEAGMIHPPLVGVVVDPGRGKPRLFVPVAQMDRLGAGPLLVGEAEATRTPFHREERELLLRRDMWDRRVIDCPTHQVRRVNDVVVGRAGETDAAAPPGDYAAAEVVLLGADIGGGALLRRLGLFKLLAGVLSAQLRPHILPWEEMELVAVGVLGTEVRHIGLNDYHPVEIAKLSQGMSTREAAELISTLDDQVAADVMEELPADRQIDIVEFLPDTRAADILEEMAPDDASDLLGDLPDERTAALLEQLAPEALTAVQQLLHYPDNTAGGLMTTRYVCLPQHLTVEATIARLRKDPVLARANMIYYVYLTEENDDRLTGVVTLRDLLLAAPEAVLADFMEREILSVAPDDTSEEVARKLAEYNLLGLPVLDPDGRLLGIITVDDALDVLLPSDWQRRLPRVFS